MHAAHPARRLRSLLVGALAGAVLLTWAGAAGALKMSPNPFTFTPTNGIEGTITLVNGAVDVPAGGNVLVDESLTGDGGDTDVTLIFQLTLDASSNAVNAIGVSAFDSTFTSQPVLAGGGDIPDSPDVNENVTGASTSGSNGVEFEFLSGGSGTLEGGETSDEFFISYETLATDGSVVLNFMISPADGSSDFTPSTSPSIIPEPASVGLVGLGLAGLAWASRRRRSV